MLTAYRGEVLAVHIGSFDMLLPNGRTMWVDPTPDPDPPIRPGETVTVIGNWSVNFGQTRNLFCARRIRYN